MRKRLKNPRNPLNSPSHSKRKTFPIKISQAIIKFTKEKLFPDRSLILIRKTNNYNLLNSFSKLDS
jgi:hypothetical protein